MPKSNTNMLGIFGGSGFYELLQNAEELDIDTPCGKPSDKLMCGEFAGQKVVFLPRHGRGHKIPPHGINYRANLLAMKYAGVTKIIAPSAMGSLRREIAPGTFVICDSYVDRTRGREDTFYHGPEVRHMTSVDPYCEVLRKQVLSACAMVGVPTVPNGTLVVVNGPRFSTIPESKWFSAQGWSVIGMTGYPEAVLANELGMCYATIGLVTDYDACFHNDAPSAGSGPSAGLKASSAQEILATFNNNLENVKKVIFEIIKNADMSACPRCSAKVEQSKFNE